MDPLSANHRVGPCRYFMFFNPHHNLRSGDYSYSHYRHRNKNNCPRSQRQEEAQPGQEPRSSKYPIVSSGREASSETPSCNRRSVSLFNREPEASPLVRAGERGRGGDSLSFTGQWVLLCNSWLSAGLGEHISVL